MSLCSSSWSSSRLIDSVLNLSLSHLCSFMDPVMGPSSSCLFLAKTPPVADLFSSRSRVMCSMSLHTSPMEVEVRVDMRYPVVVVTLGGLARDDDDAEVVVDLLVRVCHAGGVKADCA